MSSVTNTHPDWDEREYAWFLVRHAVEGQSAIKRQNSLFLPMPLAMSQIQDNPSGLSRENDHSFLSRRDREDRLENRPPNFHRNPAYSAYKSRAQFPDITKKTLRGLVGVATRKDPVVRLPQSMMYMVDEIATNTGMKLDSFFRMALSESLQTGRFPVSLDVDESTNRILLVPYVAESMINWRSGFVDGVIQPVMTVFEEDIPSPDSQSIFSHDTTVAQRVLSLQDGIYTNQFFLEGELQVTTNPSFMGRTLDFIPLVTIGSTNLDLDPDVVPLEGISDIAVHIYMKSADIGQSEFMTANPTLVYSGIAKEDAPRVIGPTGAVVLESSEAKAYYVETGGTGISSMQESVQKLFEQALTEGGELLGGVKHANEAEGTAMLRQEASGATLLTVVDTVGQGIERALKMAAVWMGENPDEVEFKPNTQFSENNMTAQDLKALLESWMQKGISYETYYTNLQNAGVASADRNAEEETELIFEETAKRQEESLELEKQRVEAQSEMNGEESNASTTSESESQTEGQNNEQQSEANSSSPQNEQNG